MIDIFNDLYKKITGFFRPEEKENVKEVACNRLKLVLMQDRTNLTPHLLERMRGELIDLLSKYVELDKEALELNFAQEGDSMALMLSIPVLRAKDEAEIQAIIEEEEKAKEKAAETDEAQSVSEESGAEGEAENEEDAEKTDEDLEETSNEEVCTCECEEKDEEASQLNEDEGESSEKQPKKK